MVHIIYNPHSGSKSKAKKLALAHALENIPGSCLHQTLYPGHAKELCLAAQAAGASRILAVGGDGTINEVASQLIGKNTPLGIVPVGSGNGLARSLGLYLPFSQAIDKALHGAVMAIDVAYFNEQAFFCTAGIGFDAEVAHHFSLSGKRGLAQYIRSVFCIQGSYTGFDCQLNHVQQHLFSLTIANAKQFGNNAYISPGSDLRDGKLELVLIKPSHFIGKALLGISLFLKSLPFLPQVEISSVESLQIACPGVQHYHLDGESFPLKNPLVQIRIQSKSLQVIC